VRVWLPGQAAIRVPWLLPAIEIVLLVVLPTHDLNGADDRRRTPRIALVLVAALVLAALWRRTCWSQRVPVDFAFSNASPRAGTGALRNAVA
jgi:hypothetical protein